jgi:enamine deaminase RidA (YjgF/YER057c/UK114 family)
MDRRSALVTGLVAATTFASNARAQSRNVASAEQRLRELGIELPNPPGAVANYVPAARMGNLIFLAGVGPIKPDKTLGTGKVGKDVSVDEAYQHARLAGLVLLAVMREAAGSLDNVVRIGKVFGMVNTISEFTDHPKVINGCSDLFVEVFGERGRHARSAAGMGSLPFNITVEIEAVIEVARG